MSHDAIIIGGSFAGLAAATQLARGRRSVCVLDTARPRNRFAAASHGFLGWDGVAPAHIVGRAREQLLAYPTTTWVEDEAVSAAAVPGGFAVRTAGGQELRASHLVLAFGIVDHLPELPGLAERWGRTVAHCPYCHGYEFGGGPLAVLRTGANSVHQAMMIPDWGKTTFLLDGAAPPDGPALGALSARGVALEPARVVAVQGEPDGPLEVRLATGATLRFAGLFVAPTTGLGSPIAAQLGCALDDGPMGPVIRVDGMQATTVPGVYAAGDIARAAHNATWAASSGVTAGAAVHRSLMFGAAA